MKVEMFFENFELLTDAPNAVAKLRQAILQLAVQGKLVRQDSNDEPASVLLKKVELEVKELVQEGKIKKINPLQAITKDAVKFQIPQSWEWARLQNVFSVVTDGDHQPPPKKEEGIPFLVIGNVREGFLNFENTRFVSEEYFLRLDESKTPKQGDILYTVVGSYGIPIIVDTEQYFCVQRHIAILKPSKFMNVNYLRYLLKSDFVFEQATNCATGIAQKTVPLNGLRNITVPVPPLAEQKRIVAKVDRLLVLCDEIEKRQQQRQESIVKMSDRALTQLLSSQNPDDFRQHWHRICNNFDLLYSIPETIPKLRQAILQLAVQGKLVRQDPNDEPASILLDRIKADRLQLLSEGKIKKFEPLAPVSEDDTPFELPKGWTWARFPELGEFGRGKSKHRPRNDPKLYKDGKYPLVQTGDVARSNGLVTTYTGLYNDVGLAQSRLWSKGTLCITIAANIADSGILDLDACIPDSVVGFVPSAEIEDARYFEFFMRTAKEHLQDYAPSTAQKNINLAILEKVLIPLPPLAEQKRIVAKVDRLMSLCDELESKLKEMRSHNEKLMEVAARQLLAL